MNLSPAAPPFPRRLCDQPQSWLVTGVAGFIGSHLLETLLKGNQRVVGLDNFATGHRRNLDDVCGLVAPAQWRRFTLIEGDIRDPAACRQGCESVDYVLHQAALGSVPRSLVDPAATHDVNVTGFVNMLIAARAAGVKRFVYASSSSVYGDDPNLPKREERIGRPLSPYALSKRINEEYADVFARAYGLAAIGLRYFNVFGPRQDPQGPYAAVIPRWFRAMLDHEPVYINGDGETSRDFCYVANAVQANLLAATLANSQALNRVYNVAAGERTTLNGLFDAIRRLLQQEQPVLADCKPVYRDFRPGDIRHSLADIREAVEWLGYEPAQKLEAGLQATSLWYKRPA